jgi:hypothetical protein
VVPNRGGHAPLGIAFATSTPQLVFCVSVTMPVKVRLTDDPAVAGGAACWGGVAERRKAITTSGAINVSSLKINEQFFCHNAHTLQPTKRYQILACDPGSFWRRRGFGVSYSLHRVDLEAYDEGRERSDEREEELLSVPRTACSGTRQTKMRPPAAPTVRYPGS